jgi:Tfp pilus assembly protein PilN
MIKVNLLDSVTDRAKGVAAVEEKVANPRMQTMLLGLVVSSLLVAGLLYDYYGSTSARDEQQKKLAEQKNIQAQMVAVNKERVDLEKKMADIQARIDAIQKLRESQQGPGAVLREIKSRFDSIPGLYLKSVEQNGGEVVIKGESPNEASITNFGKSLEFSSGLFTNLSIETQRETAKIEVAEGASAADPKANADAPKPEVVTFTIKCNYSPVNPATPAAGATGGGTTPTSPSTQVAKN